MAVETIYDHPHYYDVLFGWDRSVECDFYDGALQGCGVAHAGPVLEVACGTGRVAIELARRGRDVGGLDVSAGMVEYMQRAAAAAGVRVASFCADMTNFTTPRKYAAAYNPMSSFRLLHDDASVDAHVRCVAACLRPRGVYILDLSFDAVLGAAAVTSEAWEMTRGAVTVRADNDVVHVSDDGVERALAWGHEAHLRPYTTDTFIGALLRTGDFDCESWHPETSRATGVSEFSVASARRPIAGRSMVVLRKIS